MAIHKVGDRINEKECGCHWRVLFADYSGWRSVEVLCEKHKKERLELIRQKEIDDKKNLENKLLCADELKCDKCGSIVGYTYESDLNGSYFFCKECKENSTNE